MSGHRPFDELTKNWPESRKEEVKRKKNELQEEMMLSDLRKSLSISQEALATALEVQQPAIAKMERRDDIRIGNLRRMIEAMGGELEIRARFSQSEVKINI